MIVITGASGNIGLKTAFNLLSKGETIRAIGRNPESLETLKNMGAELAIGDMNNVEFLSTVFGGAKAVLLMIPPDKRTTDFGAFQDDYGETQVQAIKNAGVKNVVFISSQGAHNPTHNMGTVTGLARQEVRLNNLPDDVNVLSLRPEAFMENIIDSLKLFNTVASPLNPDVKTGLIATDDIANFASDRLFALDFKGKSHQDLLGDREYSQTEIAEIIGKYLDKPGLKYKQYSYEDYKNALLKIGMSDSRASHITDRYKAINEGYFNAGIRNDVSTTPTSLERFAEQVLRSMFQ